MRHILVLIFLLGVDGVTADNDIGEYCLKAKILWAGKVSLVVNDKNRIRKCDAFCWILSIKSFSKYEIHHYLITHI